MSDSNKAVKIIKSLTDLVGVTAGIILASIGAIMFLNSVFNLYIFNIKTPEYMYSDEYRCSQFDVDRIEAERLTGRGAGPVAMQLGAPNMTAVSNPRAQAPELTKEQKEALQKKFKECKEKVRKESEEKFETGEKRHIATGLAFMIVGFPLIFFYQRRKRN